MQQASAGKFLCGCNISGLSNVFDIEVASHIAVILL